MAYRPGQGIAAGAADRLRARKLAAEFCEVCGERAEADDGCATVDDSKQWTSLLGEGTGNRKKARCAECTKPLPEDHDPARGPFCLACAPASGPAPTTKAPATNAGEAAAPTDPGAPAGDVQFGHLIRPGLCKRCAAERRALRLEERRKEDAAAREKKESREQVKAQALKEGILEAPELVTVTMDERPFGMTPCKDAEGFLVAAVKDGRPAARGGVRPGWRVASVAGTSCEGLDKAAVLALTKEAELPAEVVFEALPNGGDFCTACQKILVWALFSRKMRTKPPDKRRCIACVEAAGGKE